MQSAFLGVHSMVERMVGLLSTRDVSTTRASQCIRVPQHGQEGPLADFRRSGAAGALGLALLAAELCVAIRLSEIMQGVPVELHVTILFATLTASIALHIPG